MFRRLVWIVLFSAAASPIVGAQEPFNLAVRPGKLANMFAELYGPEGLIVDSLAVLPSGATHSAHFNSAFQSEFTQFATALSSRIASVPLPSPASGFTYEFDPALGVFTRTTQSFGPIMAERAETIGSRRFSFGFTYQFFSFDTVEGLDLDNIPAVFTHDDFHLRGGREDLVITTNSIQANVNQFTGFLTYGLTDRLDVSLAVPFVSNDLTVVSRARLERIGTENPEIHFFRSLDGEIASERIFTAFGSASGIGDVTLRLKGTLSRGMGLGLDLRIPTGDEMDLLGIGAAGVRPFLILSGSAGSFSPHVNVGYLWNGSSILAGDPARGMSRDLADQAFYVAGVELSVDRVTVVLDVLGHYLIDAPRLRTQDFHALDGVSVFSNIGFEQDSFHVLSGAAGVKVNLVRDLLLDFNLLFAVNDNGLQDKVTPLVGLEYGF